jgi:hypothetical protein
MFPLKPEEGTCKAHSISCFQSKLAFYRIVEGQNVHALAILDVMTRLDVAQVAKFDAKVIACN